MYILDISYKMAIKGEYRRTISIPDWWGAYVAKRGGTVCHNTIRIRDLEFTDNHLQNIINLIHYVEKTGYDRLNILLDDGNSYSVIKDRFDLISSLPEVSVHIHELENGQKILSIIYKGNYDSLIYAELACMSSDEIEKLIDDISIKYETETSPEDKEKANIEFAKIFNESKTTASDGGSK
jgi:hypothetical protein